MGFPYSLIHSPVFQIPDFCCQTATAFVLDLSETFRSWEAQLSYYISDIDTYFKYYFFLNSLT